MIPTRNRWQTLVRFGLRAALSQRHVSVEVVVVDDHSASAPPAADELLGDPRVHLVRRSEWGGVAVARNAGIERARGDWIAFLDDDDLWAPDKLAAVVGAAERAGADFGYSSVLEVDSRLRPVVVLDAIPPTGLRAALRDGNGIYAVASNVVVRRTLLERIGGFDERFSTVADWEIVQRLAREGRPCAVGEPLVAYRSSGWLLADEPAHRADLRRLEDKYGDVNVNWNDYERWIALSLHRAGRRRDAARQYLATARRFRDPRSLLLAGSTVISRDRIDRRRRLRAPEWLSDYAAGGPDGFGSGA